MSSVHPDFKVKQGRVGLGVSVYSLDAWGGGQSVLGPRMHEKSTRVLSEQLLVLSPYEAIPPLVSLISGNGTFYAATQAKNIGVILDFSLFPYSPHSAHQQVLRMLPPYRSQN